MSETTPTPALTDVEREALTLAMCAPDPDRAPVTEIQLMYLCTVVARIKADAVAAALAPVERLAERWDGYGHGVYNVHLEESLPCSVCALLAGLRAALAEGKGGDDRE